VDHGDRLMYCHDMRGVLTTHAMHVAGDRLHAVLRCAGATVAAGDVCACASVPPPVARK
jgi:hypothetical protein